MQFLNELNPKWTGILRPNSGEGIEFDCPTCGPTHRAVAYFDNPLDRKPAAEWQKPVWRREGEKIGSLTIEPSLQYPCFHGWIYKGLYVDVSESPITLLGQTPDGKVQPVSLSPIQAAELAGSILEKLKAIDAKALPVTA